MSDHIGRVVRLAIHRFHSARHTRSFLNATTSAVNALVVLSLLIPALPANAATSSIQAAGRTAGFQALASEQASPGYQAPVFSRPEPRRSVERNVRPQDSEPTPTLEPTPTPTPEPGQPELPPEVDLYGGALQQAAPLHAFGPQVQSTPQATDPEDHPIAAGSADQNRPAVAYNSAEGKYLIVWMDSTSPESLRGRFLSREGLDLGAEFSLSTRHVGGPYWPFLLYNPTDNGFMLLWSEYNGNIITEPYFQLPALNLYALALASDGTPLSSSPALVTDQLTFYNVPGPMYGIAYNSAANEYFVAWQQPPGTVIGGIAEPHRAVGQRLSAIGALLGSQVVFQIGIVSSVAVSYSTQSNEYLLTYDRYYSGRLQYNLLAQRLRTDNLATIGSEFFVAADWGYQLDPAIGYSPASDSYFLAWADSRANWQTPDRTYLFGQFIKAGTGAFVGQNFLIMQPDNLVPNDLVVPGDVAYSPIKGNFLVVALKSTNILTERFVKDGGGFDSDPVRFTQLTGIYPRVAARLEGQDRYRRWLVTWDSGSDIYARFPSVLDVSDKSVVDSQPGMCFDRSLAQSQGSTGGPINTRTGGLDYSVIDLTLATSAGPLAFRRNYTSLTAGEGSGELGFGWTHNQAPRLIFPTDPSGEPGVVLLKADTANRLEFLDNGNGTYTAAPGICGTMVRNDGPSVTYHVKDNAQQGYEFDAAGRVLSWTNAQGNSLDYSYDMGGRLTQVTGNSGARSLALTYDDQNRIVSVTDNSGRSVTYAYDASGDLATVTDVLGGTWTYHYDAAHRLTEVVDPRGVIQERTEYDAQGRAVRQFDGEGTRTVEIAYNPNGTTTILDPLGHTQTHTYDYRHTMTGEQDPLGDLSAKTYDLSFRPATLKDPAGATTSLVWSPGGANLLQVTDASGNVTDLEYDPLNNLTAVTDPMGYLTTYIYSGNQLTSSTDALNGTTTYTYTPEGFLASATDPLGHTTSYTYDSLGQRISMMDALGHTTTYSYDDLGRLVETTDPLGHVARSEYDGAGRLTRSIRNYDPARPQNDANQYNIVTEYTYDEVGNQITVTDTYGRTTHNEYDADGRLVRIIDPQGNETTNAYDDAGRLLSTTDPLGRTTGYAYDAAGRLTATTDPTGGVTRSTYNTDGTLASTTDALGHATTYGYDALKRVTVVTDALGHVTQTTYDAAGNVASTTDALGRTTSFEYDALNRLIRQTDPEGGVTEHFYDAAGNRIQTVDPLSHRTTYDYNSLNQLTAVTDALGHATRYAYDAVGNRTSSTDGNGNPTIYSYDALGRAIATTDALGNISQTAYDALGNSVARTDANGHVTTMEFDSLGRLVRQTDAEGGTTSYTYDAVGNQLTVTDPNGHSTTTAYDELNHPVSITDPNGNVTSRAYDATGNLTSATDGLGKETTFTYDALNRQVAVTDPLGNATSYGFDAAGNRKSMTDASGIVTHYEYDGLGRLTAVVENYVSGGGSDGQTNVRTEYSYDAAGNRLSIRDGNGHVTTFDYDALNRLAQETDALGHETGYTYDAVGNRTGLTDANGVTTTYLYDQANRLTTILYPPPETPVSFTYDAAGHRLGMSDSSGQTTWEYDALNRPTVINGFASGRVGYSYDAAGNRTSLTYPDGKFVSYAYDPANRMTEVTAWDSTITTYTYDAANRQATATLPNGVHSSYTYDPAGRLLRLAHTKGTDSLSSFGYTYDAMGNRTQAVEHLTMPMGGPTVPVTVTDTSGMPLSGLTVYAMSGDSYTGYSKVTGADGVASITLPVGNYRFRVDVDGTQFWSGTANHCPIPGCFGALITVAPPVLVTVTDTNSSPLADTAVYAFDGENSTGFHGTTDANGQVALRLPAGAYRFRADFNGTQFWSSKSNDCNVPGCTLASVVVTLPVEVTVADTFGEVKPGIEVHAFSGGLNTGYHGTTDENGAVHLTLPEGTYHFRADFNGTQFWSGPDDHCTIPGCEAAVVTVTRPVTVSVGEIWQAYWYPVSGLEVYAFQGDTYTGFHATTDDGGNAVLTLPEGSYRFRTDRNGTPFWDSPSDECTVPGCENADILVTHPITVTVQDTDASPQPGLEVYAFDGGTYTGYHATTDDLGRVDLTLPVGMYRFRADLNGTQFWSEPENHCDVFVCDAAVVTVTKPVAVMIMNTEGLPLAEVTAYAFDGTNYTGYNGRSDADGIVRFTLPIGSYRFRADVDGTQYWSGDTNHCTIPGCITASVTIGQVALPTSTPTPEPSATSTPTIEASPSCTPTLEPSPTETETPTSTATQIGNLGAGRVLAMPASLLAHVAPQPPVSDQGGRAQRAFAPSRLLQPASVAVTVNDTSGQPKAGLPVYAFDGLAYSGYSATTNAEGVATLALPDGSYRFRADFNGTQFWSGDANHCTVPGCEAASVTVTVPVVVSVVDTGGQPQAGLPVYAFDGTAYTGFSTTTDATGQGSFTLPQGNYRFRSDLNGTQFWSGDANHCFIPGCTSAQVTVTIPVIVTVHSIGGSPQAGVPVYAFDGDTYTGHYAATNSSGEATLTLPQGTYRFRADFNATQFWSGEANHCTVPGCTTAAITVTGPITVTVVDTEGNPKAGLPVYVFDGAMFTGFSGVTDTDGDVLFTLPAGSYRFRADLQGTQFWSSDTNECTVPGCEIVTIEVTSPIEVTVLDTGSAPKEGLQVYAFDGDTYTGFNGLTDATGQATFVLPVGSYRFRSDLNGTQFWSGEANHCDVPGCVAASITVTIPVTVTVKDQAGKAYPALSVYAFNGDTYTGFSGTSDAEGKVVFTLPLGDYRFRADLDGVQFWSGEVNTCTVPGCTEDTVPIPGGTVETNATIDYTYDPLYRLTAANYDNGTFFHYTYDAVGNRLTQVTEKATNAYTYDIANRLTSVDGVAYTWDANGDLLSDGTSTYSYDSANRLKSVIQGGKTYAFSYNGLGDRVGQTVTDGTSYAYALDMAGGLAQVLDDGTNAYLYGAARVGELQPGGWQYHLDDALGSVRELADSTGSIGLARSFEPYGSVLPSSGTASTAYNFTGEQLDQTGLEYLRARYYASYLNQWIQPDPIVPDPRVPADWNRYAYVRNNPVNLTDPTGEYPTQCQSMPSASEFERCVIDYYHVSPVDEQSLGADIDGARGCYHGRVHYRAPGYIEGVGGFLGTTWAGIERVYSFARMERTGFGFLGFGLSDSTIGAGLADYAGAVLGLRSDRILSETYRGLSFTGQGGMSIPLGLLFGGVPGNMGSGISLFKSVEDSRVWGATLYVGGTLSEEALKGPFSVIDVGGALVQYYSLTGSERAYADGRQVNKLALIADIVTSNPLWVEPFYPLSVYARGSAAVSALHYAWVYEELASLAP